MDFKRVWMGIALGSAFAMMACARTDSPNEVKSAQEPHRAIKGPWFEGWYARATDLEGGGSLAVIVGSHVSATLDPEPSMTLPGYIGVLYSTGHGSPTKSWTFFPAMTRVSLDGQLVTQDPNIFANDDKKFVWEAADRGISAKFENDKVVIDAPGQLQIAMEFGPGKSWDQSQWHQLPLGPEGYLATLPVPLHWYVKSLNSPGQYKLKIFNQDGSTTEKSAKSSFHLEKNWGKVFPKAWNWLQAHSPETDAQIVLGGGTVDLEAFNRSFGLKAWLAGYRSPVESWDLKFSDPGTSITVNENSCSGKFKFHAERFDLEVDIEAQSPLDTFGAVAVPTDKGFVADYGAESFSSTIAVKTYRKTLFGKKLTDSRVFTSGALEFGAESYRRDCP